MAQTPGHVGGDKTIRSIEMLKAVLDHRTYRKVGTEHGLSRTTVERQVKTLAARLNNEVGVDGLNESGIAFVRRLRTQRDPILAALEKFDPQAEPPREPTLVRIVSDDELARAVTRIRSRSHDPARDVALFLMPFFTAAWPLEIARIEVRDYLNPDGTVRRESIWRSEVANGGRARPLFFNCSTVDQALGDYLDERLAQRLGLGEPGQFRGLDGTSPIFLTRTGQPLFSTVTGPDARIRHECTAIQELYRRLFRYADKADVTNRSARHTAVAKLYARGADDANVAEFLGMSNLAQVRRAFPRQRVQTRNLVAEFIELAPGSGPASAAAGPGHGGAD
jgi:integrase